MFNDYVWQTYLNAGGKDVAKAFETYLTNGLSEDYAGFIVDLQKNYCPSTFVLNHTNHELSDLFHDLSHGMGLLDEGEYTIATAMDALYSQIKGNDQISPQKVFNYFSGSVAYFTTLLSIELPELFVPYYFTWNFNVFEKIANEFVIDLLPIPMKKDYEDRFYYYGAICIALLEFRKAHNMSPYELCAFLYDFAPKYIGGISSYIITDLPEPKSAFFIGGSKDDADLAKDPGTITCWQCDPDTRAGDLIVMYLRAPISSVDSVWRSVSVGFNDPFFYYYRCTYIANPITIKQITLKKLQKDTIFKNIPIVRKNMQGINGVELKPSEYNHLVDLAKADIPKLQFIVSDGGHEFVNEKDVENKLIKPLISKLGYPNEKYVQQLYIEIGNHNHALIPDFVLLPVTTRGHQSAFAIIEAKHTIANQKNLEEVKIQARSYAVQLRATYSVIASKDKLWVYTFDDDFTTEIFSASWDELNNADTFSSLFKLLGNND